MPMTISLAKGRKRADRYAGSRCTAAVLARMENSERPSVFMRSFIGGFNKRGWRWHQVKPVRLDVVRWQRRGYDDSHRLRSPFIRLVKVQ